MSTPPRFAYQHFFNHAKEEVKKQHLIADFEIAKGENKRFDVDKKKIAEKMKEIINR